MAIFPPNSPNSKTSGCSICARTIWSAKYLKSSQALTTCGFSVFRETSLTGEIPPELGGLDKLKVLHLSGNDLTGEIPAELGDACELKELVLDFNELTGAIPPELGSLANLQSLRLQWNSLTGEIPPELGNLGRLKDLILRGNQLTGRYRRNWVVCWD